MSAGGGPGRGPSAARRLREQLAAGRLLRYPGAFSPLVARAVQEAGFDGVYVSGAALSADLALPDIGLTTATEVVGRSAQIAAATSLPVLVDADTGFGEPANVARTVGQFERAGVAGIHLEDQVNPKRCGHLDGKALVSTAEAARRIAAAITARSDPDFVVCARTDARAVEGFDGAVARAREYVAAGADMIFIEALADADEFARFRDAVDVPLLANMTEFGKSELLDAASLERLGYDVVIYPVTTLRIALGAIERALATIRDTGTQQSLVPEMATRARLYELVRYEDYNAFDASIHDFTLDGNRDA